MNNSNKNFNNNSVFAPHLLAQVKALDMAAEAHSLLKGDADVEIAGVAHSEQTFACGPHTAKTVTIEILDDYGAELLGRDIGSYITIELPAIHTAQTADLLQAVGQQIVQSISSLLPQNIPIGQPILLVGLGNFQTTADAIGPKVIARIQPTNHIFRPQFAADIRPVAALSPGVVGNTGIETADLIKDVCSRLNPAAVIVIDALAAGKIANVLGSIQICNTGIRPGSGVQNHRRAINQAYLGVPVLAIGIPTVVQATAIIREVVQLCQNQPQEDTTSKIIHQMLANFAQPPVLTPKETDELIHLAAHIIAAGLTMALHPAADINNYTDYMQGV